MLLSGDVGLSTIYYKDLSGTGLETPDNDINYIGKDNLYKISGGEFVDRGPITIDIYDKEFNGKIASWSSSTDYDGFYFTCRSYINEQEGYFITWVVILAATAPDGVNGDWIVKVEYNRDLTDVTITPLYKYGAIFAPSDIAYYQKTTEAELVYIVTGRNATDNNELRFIKINITDDVVEVTQASPGLIAANTIGFDSDNEKGFFITRSGGGDSTVDSDKIFTFDYKNKTLVKSVNTLDVDVVTLIGSSSQTRRGFAIIRNSNTINAAFIGTNSPFLLYVTYDLDLNKIYQTISESRNYIKSNYGGKVLLFSEHDNLLYGKTGDTNDADNNPIYWIDSFEQKSKTIPLLSGDVGFDITLLKEIPSDGSDPRFDAHLFILDTKRNLHINFNPNFRSRQWYPYSFELFLNVLSLDFEDISDTYLFPNDYSSNYTPNEPDQTKKSSVSYLYDQDKGIIYAQLMVSGSSVPVDNGNSFEYCICKIDINFGDILNTTIEVISQISEISGFSHIYFSQIFYTDGIFLYGTVGNNHIKINMNTNTQIYSNTQNAIGAFGSNSKIISNELVTNGFIGAFGAFGQPLYTYNWDSNLLTNSSNISQERSTSPLVGVPLRGLWVFFGDTSIYIVYYGSNSTALVIVQYDYDLNVITPERLVESQNFRTSANLMYTAVMDTNLDIIYIKSRFSGSYTDSTNIFQTLEIQQLNKTIPIIEDWDAVNLYRISAEGSESQVLGDALPKLLDEYRGNNAIQHDDSIQAEITTDANFGGEKVIKGYNFTYATGIPIVGNKVGLLFTWEKNAGNNRVRLWTNDNTTIQFDGNNGNANILLSFTALSGYALGGRSFDLLPSGKRTEFLADAHIFYIQMNALTTDSFLNWTYGKVMTATTNVLTTPYNTFSPSIFNFGNDGHKLTEFNVFNLDSFPDQAAINTFINAKANVIATATSLTWTDLT